MTALDILHTWATNSDVEIDVVNDHHAVVVLPGEKKLKTAVSVKESHHSLDCQAFIIRRPDENHLTFATYLLRKIVLTCCIHTQVTHLNVVLRDAVWSGPCGVGGEDCHPVAEVV